MFSLSPPILSTLYEMKRDYYISFHSFFLKPDEVIIEKLHNTN